VLEKPALRGMCCLPNIEYSFVIGQTATVRESPFLDKNFSPEFNNIDVVIPTTFPRLAL
tara:strand:- start:683 stop:859 length:177 start_codon:yes stop_codon:yes gene_type:complete